MFSLDRSKNDTSTLLDLLRAIAAQMVCVGHTWNLVGLGRQTLIPDIGVMLFFVLSGFVIAFTLHERTKSGAYSLVNYVVERFARIYSAYAPALLLIAALDYVAHALGAPIVPDSTTSFFTNLAMLQGYPSEWGGPTFGTAGQLSSLSAEFHIYYFVGGTFFFCIGRNRIAGLLLVIAFAAMPLSYFTEASDTARSLFVLWLLGFAGYFIVINIKIDRTVTAGCAALSVFMFWRWRVGHVHGNEYALISYLPFAAWFVCLAIAAQGNTILSRRRTVVEFFANYSYSLFLIHFTIIKIVSAWSLLTSWLSFGAAIFVANVAAYYFADVTEARHKQLASWILLKLRPSPRVEAPIVYQRNAE